MEMGDHLGRGRCIGGQFGQSVAGAKMNGVVVGPVNVAARGSCCAWGDYAMGLTN